jgi:hypothetical protein
MEEGYRREKIEEGGRGVLKEGRSLPEEGSAGMRQESYIMNSAKCDGWRVWKE